VKSDPDKKRLQRLRAAVRNVWQYDPLRKKVLQLAQLKEPDGTTWFKCDICQKKWPIDMATVDHEPALGGFTLKSIGDWVWRMFMGPQRAVCKPCHRKKKD